MRFYLHGEALPTPGVSAAEGPLPLVVSVNVALQVEAARELFAAALPGARELPLLPRVDAQLVLVQEPGVVEQLLALVARQLGCRGELYRLKHKDFNPLKCFDSP